MQEMKKVYNLDMCFENDMDSKVLAECLWCVYARHGVPE